MFVAYLGFVGFIQLFILFQLDKLDCSRRWKYSIFHISSQLSQKYFDVTFITEAN
jgi:hypothetical protein